MTDVKEPTEDKKTDAAPVTKKRRHAKGKARTRYFEIGRVCQINFGPYAGKICIILDFVDATRCLIDGPECRTGVPRQTIPFGRLSVTKIKIHILRACRTGLVRKAFDDGEVARKWARQNWAKRTARAERRRQLTDLERFKVMRLRMKKSRMIRDHLAKLHEWRRLAFAYKQGTTDKPEELLAAKRCLFGMKNYRNIKNLKYDTDYDLSKPLNKEEFNRLKHCMKKGEGFKPWKRLTKRSHKISKARSKKKHDYATYMKIKRYQTSKRLPRAELLARIPKPAKETLWQHKRRLRNLFKGKTHEEVILMKRKYRQHKKWKLHIMYRKLEKKKKTRQIKHFTLMKKLRKAKEEKRAAYFKKHMELNPKFKEKVEKRRASRKKERMAIKAKKLAAKKERNKKFYAYIKECRRKRKESRAAKAAAADAAKASKK